MKLSPSAAAAVAATLLVGCGSDSAGDTQGSMEATSEQSELEGRFTLRPDPPAVGLNQLEMALRTADGDSASGAIITIEPWMSVHGHGANETPTISDLGDGNYRADNVEYTMPGSWELRIDVTMDDRSDQFVLDVEVE